MISIGRPAGLSRMGVVDVDVANDRKAEQRQRLLAVDQGDHRGLPLAGDRAQGVASRASITWRVKAG
jgi:hypothetical protein